MYFRFENINQKRNNDSERYTFHGLAILSEVIKILIPVAISQTVCQTKWVTSIGYISGIGSRSAAGIGLFWQIGCGIDSS